MADQAGQQMPVAQGDGRKEGESAAGRVSAREIDVIRQDRTTGLVKGMFVLDPDPERKEVITQSVRTRDGVVVTYRFTPMGAFDLRVLHAVSAMAMGSFRGEAAYFDASDTSAAAEEAWAALSGGATRGALQRINRRWVGIIRTTKRQLAEVVSRTGTRPGGKDLERCYSALKRLSEVTLHIASEDRKNEFTTHLINGLGRDDDRVVIAINPSMMNAIAREAGAFSLMSMHALRAVRQESTTLIVNKMCSFLDPGKSIKVGMERFEEYIWGDVLPRTTPAEGARHNQVREDRKARYKTIRRALAELPSIGWGAELCSGTGSAAIYLISRPKLANPEPIQVALELPAAAP